MTTVEQLFEIPSQFAPQTPSSSTAEITTLPDISFRPDSASQSATRTRSASRVIDAPASIVTPQPAMQKSAPVTFPMSAAVALEKYRRVLTSLEQHEILNFQTIYFLAPLAKKIQPRDDLPNSGFDDDKGRYKCIKNDHLNYRYEILKGLGKGSFGDVVKTYDHKTKANVAVKIVRNEKRFHKQGQIEVKILDQLRKLDKKGTHNVIHMNDFFVFRNHLCITFDLLNVDLYSALKKDNFKGFSLKRIQKISQGVLQCLRLLRHSKIIHCDLKPENILLVSENSDDVRVIDFGSSCLDHQRIHTYIQSRFYRSPEVILGSDYGTPIDMWSFACILVELYTGHPIFPGHDEREQLMLQMEVLGVPPREYLETAKRHSIFFNPDFTPRATVDRKGKPHPPSSRSLARAVGCDDPLFIDFLAKCFCWNPAERMTPREAAKHPFITGLDAPPAPLSTSSSRVIIDESTEKGEPTVARKPSRILPTVPSQSSLLKQTASKSSLNSFTSSVPRPVTKRTPSTSSISSISSNSSKDQSIPSSFKPKLVPVEDNDA